MAVKVRIQTEADIAALDRYQKELDETRKKLIASGKPLDEFTKEMRKLDSQQRALNKLTPQTTSHFGKLKDMFGGFVITGGDVVNATRAVAGAMWDTIQTASSLTEAQNKVGQVFNDSLPAVRAFGDGAAESIGMSERAALSATGTYGNLFRAFGIGEKQAADMSMELVQLAADLASFNDTSIDDALEALRSGISGETEPLKRFGVALNDARMKQEALNMGIYDGVGVLDPAQKAQAAYSVIMKDTAIAQGDFARNSDELANSMRTLEGSWENLKASFGEGMMGSAGEGASELNDLLQDMEPGAAKAGRAISWLATNTADFLYQATAAAKDDLGQLSSVQKMVYDTWRNDGYAAEMTLRDFNDAVNDGTVKIDGLYVATGSAADATGALEGATDDATGATKDATAADQDAAAAKQELVRAMDGQKVAADSAMGIERTLSELTNDAAQADIAAAEAQEDYTNAQKDGKSSARDIEKARLRAEDATRRAADANADLRAEEEKLGTTLTEASKNAEYERWLIGMRDRARELARALGTVGYQSGAIVGKSGSGGRVLEHAAGGYVDRPVLSTLAEHGWREYVITTEPAYRSRSLDLYEQLGDRLGVSSSSITIAPGAVQISVSGSSASPSAIAAEVEAALRRIVRSSQLMGA